MVSRLLLLTLAFIGCKPGDEANLATPPDLQIVSAGNEPRQRVRYQPKPGSTHEVDLAVDVEVTAGDMGGPLPTIVMSLSTRVADAQPAGLVKLQTRVLDAQARDRDESRVLAKALGGPLDQIKGISVETTLTASGRVVTTKVDTTGKELPDTAKAQLGALTTSFDQLMMPLPDVPIGVGAVWRNSRPLEQNGMKMVAVNSVQVMAIRGDVITYELDTEVHGDDQTIKQGDITLEIKDITGTGRGQGTIDLRTLAVTSTLVTEFRSKMKTPGEPEMTPMKMVINSRVGPKAAAPQGAQSAP